jgi:uncharacterized repeat protein (TIGR03803 family)
MQTTKIMPMVATALVVVVVLMAPHSACAASTEKVLYSFTGADGSFQPYSSLIFDKTGNLYGTTYGGSNGTVFELKTDNQGHWSETALFLFTGGSPYDSLIFDTKGNLYGTTSSGGTYGFGTVFELTPQVATGNWTEKALYNFCAVTGRCLDGARPYAGLIFDKAGNLYGTTNSGGTHGAGTVFKLTRGATGKWTKKTLYNFCSVTARCLDGGLPYAGLIFDKAGNLYGTTAIYGAGEGTVFELTRGAKGKWTEKVLYSFGGTKDGAFPFAGLIFDKAGNLYGTTSQGGLGKYGLGTVFELKRGAAGMWTEKVLHRFDSKDGSIPYASLVFDGKGNLYGTTDMGGVYGKGTVFKLTRGAAGKWTEEVLHSFGNGADGRNPYGSLIFDKKGNLYGTTVKGGDTGAGTVFEFTP